MPCSQSKLVLAAGVACCLQLASASASAQQNEPCNTGPMATLLATVADETTRMPLAGALVIARWQGGDRQSSARTDSAGRATLCVPAHQPVTIRSSYFDVTSSLATLSIAGATTTHATTINVPGSLVRGRVIDQQTGAPIARVSVRFTNTRASAITDTTGRFYFERIPVGDYNLRVEHIGYATNNARVTVRDDDLDALVRLTPAAIALQPIVVTVFSRRLEHVGFYERRKRGVGTFIDRKQIDAMNVQDASDLLRRVGSLRLIPHNRRNSGQPRNATVGRRGNCRFTFIVDGTRTLPDFEMDYVAAAALEGVEVYNGLAEVPALFKAHASSAGGSSSCGVIALWSRNSR